MHMGDIYFTYITKHVIWVFKLLYMTVCPEKVLKQTYVFMFSGLGEGGVPAVASDGVYGAARHSNVPDGRRDMA